MALARDQTTAGLLAELDACADLIAGLTEADLAMETPFHGWPVRSVAGHMAGTITDALSGRTENLALLATAARQANERRDRTSREIADELRGARVAAATILHALDDQAWAQPVVADFPGTLG